MSTYRDGELLRCPACGSTMDQQPIEEAMIDVCQACGGVWADRDDGSLGTVATQAHVPPLDDAVEAPSAHACPRCAHELEPCLVESVALRRCRRCRGTFLPRATIDAAMWLGPEEPPMAPMQGLGAWIRRLFGQDER